MGETPMLRYLNLLAMGEFCGIVPLCRELRNCYEY